MSRLVARLILAMLMLPFSVILLILLMMAADMMSRGSYRGLEEWLYSASWLIVDVFIATYWLWLWRGVVHWTAERRRRTLLAAIPALLASSAVFYPLDSVMGVSEPAIIFAGGIAPIVWVFLTVLIWRESPAERMERIKTAGTDNIACPICGYNMTGLLAAQCPECGAKFTLDELLAGQSKKDHASLPDE